MLLLSFMIALKSLHLHWLTNELREVKIMKFFMIIILHHHCIIKTHTGHFNASDVSQRAHEEITD